MSHTEWDGLAEDVCSSRTDISLLWVVLLSKPHWLRWLGRGCLVVARQVSLSRCSGLSCLMRHTGWDGLEEDVCSSGTGYLFPDLLGRPALWTTLAEMALRWIPVVTGQISLAFGTCVSQTASTDDMSVMSASSLHQPTSFFFQIFGGIVTLKKVKKVSNHGFYTKFGNADIDSICICNEKSPFNRKVSWDILNLPLYKSITLNQLINK